MSKRAVETKHVLSALDVLKDGPVQLSYLIETDTLPATPALLTAVQLLKQAAQIVESEVRKHYRIK